MIKIDLPKTTAVLGEASFKAGSSAKVIGLVLKVLAKRLSTKFALSPIPWTYKSTDGQFKGYYAFFGGMNSAIRLNFLLTKSDKIVSVDYFESSTKSPKYSIDLNGINIVQVIDTIVSVIDGTYSAQLESIIAEELPLEEARVTVKDMVFQWIESDPAIMTDITSGRKNWGELFADFTSYAEGQRWRVPVINGFKWGIKEYAKENPGVRLNILSPRVRRGAPETAVVVDTASQKQFTALTVENEHLKKFDMLETYVKMIGRQSNKLNAMIIYGQAGIGKTTMVKNVFKDMGLTAGVDYVIKSGSISGKTGLRQLLWDYREGMIIVLDDNDGILKNQDAVNMLKPALQDKDRIVSMTKVRSGGRPGRSTSNESVVSEETVDLTSMDSDAGIDRARLDQAERERVEREAAAEAERIEREAEEERERIANMPIPDDFEFSSKMIFVSNLMDFPSALKSRSIAIKIDMSVEQTMDLIKTNLDKVMSEFDEITIDMKQDVFNFIAGIAGSLESMDFRQFQFALIPYLAIVEDGGNPRTDTSWQDWAIIQLTS